MLKTPVLLISNQPHRGSSLSTWVAQDANGRNFIPQCDLTLRSQQTEARKECFRRLYHYYRTLAPQLPNSFKEMEPLFSAVICGCNAGLYREALHEVYIARIHRGDASFAANFLGARSALLSVLVHFFERGRWGSLAQTRH
jgi:hypothetical protein